MALRRIAIFAVIVTVLAASGVAQKVKRFKTPTETAPFVGTWKLVSSMERMADGTEKPYGFGPHATGMLMYDGSGHMCVQVMNPDRPQWKDPDNPSPAEVRTSFDGFGGYCGRFTVDVEKHTLTHIPEVSFDPNVTLKPSPRTYSFDGEKLVYEGTDKSEGAEAHWTMIWERVQ